MIHRIASNNAHPYRVVEQKRFVKIEEFCTQNSVHLLNRTIGSVAQSDINVVLIKNRVQMRIRPHIIKSPWAGKMECGMEIVVTVHLCYHTP